MRSVRPRIFWASSLRSSFDIEYFGNSTPASAQSAPEMQLCLQVHLGIYGSRAPLWHDTTPATTPAMLQAHAVTVDLASPLSDKAQDLCDEPLWVCFAETALVLPHLRHAELRQERDAEGVDESAFLGTIDAAFKPPIEAGRLLFRCVGTEWEKATDMVNSKGRNRKKPADKALGGGGGSGMLHEESGAVKDGNCKRSVFNLTLLTSDMRAANFQ